VSAITLPILGAEPSVPVTSSLESAPSPLEGEGSRGQALPSGPETQTAAVGGVPIPSISGP
jgi:hypothetical protein